MTPDYRVVARQLVPTSEAVCLSCKQPFEYGKNIFTREGMKEVEISGMCEKCFDSLFEDEE